jgi:hypothetical protein
MALYGRAITALVAPQAGPARKHYAVCDGAGCGSGSAIHGVRFKCGLCADYDLCRACFGVNTADATWGSIHAHNAQQWTATTLPPRVALGSVEVGTAGCAPTVPAPSPSAESLTVGMPLVPGGVPYRFRLSHTHRGAADATVTVDGRSIGTFRVDAGCAVEVARPADADRALTFMAHGDAGAAAAGLTQQAAHGRVSVAWRFDAARLPPAASSAWRGGGDNDMVLCAGFGGAARCAATGGTVLGGATGHAFHTVAAITPDPALDETVLFTMVIDESIAAAAARPVALTAYKPATPW